jgi:hypothetical protein
MENPGGSKPRVRDDVILRQLDDDWVVYDPDGNQLHVLNLAAVAVWTLCDGEMTVETMADELRDIFDAAPGRPEVVAQVRRVVDDLAAAGLLA